MYISFYKQPNDFKKAKVIEARCVQQSLLNIYTLTSVKTRNLRLFVLTKPFESIACKTEHTVESKITLGFMFNKF